MVVIFQHVPFEGPGVIVDMLEGRGVPFVIIHGYDGEVLPHTPAGYSGVISMGGPMSANDDLAYLEKENSRVGSLSRCSTSGSFCGREDLSWIRG
jgi:GMP synthase-like glutamine amidotransferase